MATQVRYALAVVLFLAGVGACTAEKPVEEKKTTPLMIVKPRQAVLTPEQRAELGFPSEMISRIELSAGAEASPYYVTVLMQTENLKGDKGFESRKLAGFSVRTRSSDEVIDKFRRELRAKGYLIFKTQRGYGRVPDIVSVIRGTSSYDILKILETEATAYHNDTRTIIAWLKSRQQEGSFVVTGGGADWVEARFVKPPKDYLAFSRKVAAFAPDVLSHGPRTVERLAEQIEKQNGFYLVWD
jgi:hypothetical protein